jgi:hypothetical protein
MLTGLVRLRSRSPLSRRLPLLVVVLLAMGGDPWASPLSRAERHAAEAAVTLELQSDPPLEQIVLDTRPTQLTFTVSADGKALQAGHLAVQVLAPPRPILLPSPHPALEGTTLLELDSDLTDGMFTLEYLFPIQGAYGFDFDIVPTTSGQSMLPTKLHGSIQVRADQGSLRRAWLFRVVLFSLGGIAGAWYAWAAQTPKTPPSRAATAAGAVVVGGLVLVTGSFTCADHGPRQLVFPRGTQVIQGDAGWALEVRPTPAQAVVGELLEIAVTLTNAQQVFSGAMDVAMHVYNLKDDRTVLRTNILAPHGSTSQRFQVVESAPHTCTITARPVSGGSGKPVTLTAVLGIDVIATPAPITVKLRVMGVFLGVVGAGVASGFLLSNGVRRLPWRVAL